MEAVTATDESGVQYYVACTSHPQYSSKAWQGSPVYQVSVPGKDRYAFLVRTRDESRYENMSLDSDCVTVDLKPPTPDPMTWSADGQPLFLLLGPNTMTDYWALMEATQADDESSMVEYYFKCWDNSGFSSGWQASRSYTVQLGGSWLAGYSFQVKARDKDGNETAWSARTPMTRP